jgi:hypothetical protein
MSLQHVARHLASKGRGEDTTLVHMTPREVGGLQALAKAHGGSLTINPHTGLAEAGFLRNLLPALAGAGLMMIPGMQALGAAAIVGGGTALAKGDLKAGLMAGLGAYGGAGLAEGAMAGAGAEGAGAGGSTIPSAPDVSTATATPVETIQAGGQAAPATQQYAGAYQPSSFSSAPSDTLTQTQAYSPTPTNYGAFGEAPAPVDSGVSVSDATQQQASASYGNQTTPQTPTNGAPSGTGIGRVGQNFMAKPQYGIAAIAPALNTDRQALPEEEEYDGPLSQYKFDPNKYRSADRSQPNPYYQARMYNYAEGGPIERMSNQNEVGMNTGYPGAGINQGAYATPWQTPVSRNVVTGSADVGVNPMNGEMNFAAGGNVQLQGRVTIDGQGGDQGGFGQGANGYQAGGSSIPGFSGGMQQPQGGGNGFGGAGFDPRAIAANPQAFQQFLQGARQQEMQNPGSTMLSQLGQAASAGFGFAGGGGISSLGGYSDGGRMLKGPGDGMSDSIPAKIGSKQPARLADGEFVVPADVVSHLGNGSTDAGARQLYSMMDRIRSQRTGKKKQAPKVNPTKAMPA